MKQQCEINKNVCIFNVYPTIIWVAFLRSTDLSLCSDFVHTFVSNHYWDVGILKLFGLVI